MCDICRPLILCPLKRRREVQIAPPRHPKFTDHYGRKFTVDGPAMVIDRHPKRSRCFIQKLIFDENSVCYEFHVDNIRFCPFCGEAILPIESPPKPSNNTPNAHIREYHRDGTYTEYETEDDK